MAKKSTLSFITEYSDELDQGRKDILFNKIVKRLSKKDGLDQNVLNALSLNDHNTLKTKLTAFYKQNFEQFSHATNKMIAHLKKRYTKAYDDFADEYHIHYTALDLTDIMLDYYFKKRNELPKRTKFPRMMFPLINQIGALLRANKKLYRPQENSEDDLQFYRQRILATHHSLTKTRITTAGEQVKDIDTIKLDRSPITRIFIKAFHIVTSALIIGAGFTIARMIHSNDTRGHVRFWQPKNYDFDLMLKEIENKLHFQR